MCCDGLALSHDTSLFRFVFEMEFYLDDLLLLLMLFVISVFRLMYLEIKQGEQTFGRKCNRL